MSAAVRGLERPNARTALEALARLVGEADAQRAWTHACALARVTAAEPSLDELLLVLEHLRTIPPPLVAVTATSLRVRVHSYLAIARAETRGAKGGGQ